MLGADRVGGVQLVLAGHPLDFLGGCALFDELQDLGVLGDGLAGAAGDEDEDRPPDRVQAGSPPPWPDGSPIIEGRFET